MSDLPRLLLCSFDVIPGPSGSSRRVTEYLKALPDRFSVVVLSAKTPDHSHIEKYQGARLLRVPVGSGDLASRIQAFERAVRRQLESEEYALAHFTDPFGGYALCERKADFGYRLIYEAQTFPSQELRYTHPQTEGDRRFLSKIRRQELFCLMNADLIVTGSQTTRSYIQSLGASEELIRVLRAPVDLKPYTPDVMGAPDGEPLRMMYLGSQVGWQGLSTLLRAVAHAARQVPVRLTVVGAQHPDWQPHLDDLVKELGLKEQVEFQPPVQHDDLAKVLALTDVGVLPLDDVERNRLQGGPLAKVSEYFAAGRPVIASDLPVTRELIPEDAALFFPPGDIVALALSIIELARDIPRRVELGRRARAHAERVLDAGLIRGQLLDLYDSLLEKRSERVASTSEDDLPAPTTVTGTPTNRLAALLPPEGARGVPPSADAGTGQAPGARADAAAPREDLPLVMGHALEEGVDTRLIKTEPDAKPTEPPVVMGLPLREPSPPPSGTEAKGGSRADAEPGREEPPSLAEAPPAPTPVVRAPSAEELAASRGMAAQGREEPPAPTPVVRGPEAPEREEPPAPTPVVRSPVEPEREAPAAPTPVVRSPVEKEASSPVVPERRESSSWAAVRGSSEPERKEPPSGARGPAEPERKVPPAPLPVSAEAEATPAPTPIVRAPAALEREEPPAPTPIIRIPAALLSDEPPAPTPTPIVRAPTAPSLGDEPPAPTPIVPARAVFASRGTSARMETPVARTTALPSSPRAETAERPRVETPSGRTPSVGSGSRSALSSQPPVLRPGATPDADRPPIRGGLPTADRQPGLPPRAPAPPPVPRQRPPRLTPEGPPRLDPVSTTGSRPALPSSLKGPAHPEDEPEEISEDEAQAIEDGDSGLTPPHSRPHVDEPDEISSDEVEEAEISATNAARLIEDEEELQDAEPTPANASQPVDEGPAPEPIPSSLNPWFAQLAHGYCPPEGIRFDRHTPPTTFPGRDDGTDPARLPAASRAQGVVRGKSS